MHSKRVTIEDWDGDGAIRLPDEALQELGLETIRLEREFNCRAGFTAADDRLPEWMTEEALTPTGAVFDVPAADLDGVFD